MHFCLFYFHHPATAELFLVSHHITTSGKTRHVATFSNIWQLLTKARNVFFSLKFLIIEDQPGVVSCVTSGSCLEASWEEISSPILWSSHQLTYLASSPSHHLTIWDGPSDTYLASSHHHFHKNLFGLCLITHFILISGLIMLCLIWRISPRLF